MEPILIDPGVVTLVGTTLLGQLEAAVTIVAGHAFRLLYFFTALELVLVGLAWALQRDWGLDKLFFKIIKIGLIFFIIGNYRWLIDNILSGFTQISGEVINNAEIDRYLLNPTMLWQYGYDAGVNLLQLASNSNMLGLSLVQLLLGSGILLVFGLLGIQLIIHLAGFYFVSFGALIMLPFGAFHPSRQMLNRAVQAVFKAGLRLMSLLVIVGIAVITWDKFDLTQLQEGNNFNLNQPLGLFFTALLFLNLSYYIPKILTQVVAEIGLESADQSNIAHYTVNTTGGAYSGDSPNSGLSTLQAATTLDTSTAASNLPQAAVVVTATSTTSDTPTAAGSYGQIVAGESSIAHSSRLTKSISDATVKKIKEDLVKSSDHGQAH